MDFGETLSQRPLGEVCAGGVSKHQQATYDPCALLFFTIPKFRTGGRAAIAPDCRSGVHVASEVRVLLRASSSILGA